jgi:cell wall-associated NlpC family hydrolase
MKSQLTILALVLAVTAAPLAAADTAPAPAEETAAGAPAAAKGYFDRAGELVIHALSLIGVKYKWGGNDPQAGLDCSGLVSHVFSEVTGMVLPRDSRSMSKVGAAVDKAELQPGDLVFFNTLRKPFSHVGIYIGEDRFVHAPRRGREVEVSELRDGYWKKRFNGARRLLP